MYMANGNEDLNTIFQIQMKSLQYRFWSSLCFAEIATEEKFSTKTYIGDALIILGNNNFRICDHEGRKNLKTDHRIEGGNIRIEEIFEESYNTHKKSLQSCGVLFVEQLMEPYTNRLLKWTHFIRHNELTPRTEPNWFRIVKQQISIVDNNNRIVIDDIKIRRSDDKKRILLRKDLDNKSKKETNKELITWNSDNNIIYSIKSKKSRHKKYDEIGRHMVEDKDLNINNEDDNSPYLVDCKGCEYNIGRKLNKNKCFIYIEKDIAITYKGRNEKTEVEGLKIFKPYMTRENIFRQNELINKNVVKNIGLDIDNNMNTDEEEEDIIDNCLKWLEFCIEKSNKYDEMLKFVTGHMKQFIDKEILLQIGAIIQKGDEWSLDGMFALEIFAKNSIVEKFNLDGKLRMVKNVKKVYIIALIVAIIILPCNISLDLRIDFAIAEWLTKYSKIGSTRRELDDNLYIYLNFLNTILELKNMTLNILCKTSDVMKDMQEIKLPALKKELIKCKDSIEEIVIKLDNLIVDEYCLRWNLTPIEGALCERLFH
ncbi:unnamed protein product [Rhizophagus irregularis]|nr:unnamed protein product [Rhizophagus irregularis]